MLEVLHSEQPGWPSGRRRRAADPFIPGSNPGPGSSSLTLKPLGHSQTCSSQIGVGDLSNTCIVNSQSTISNNIAKYRTNIRLRGEIESLKRKD